MPSSVRFSAVLPFHSCYQELCRYLWKPLLDYARWEEDGQEIINRVNANPVRKLDSLPEVFCRVIEVERCKGFCRGYKVIKQIFLFFVNVQAR